MAGRRGQKRRNEEEEEKVKEEEGRTAGRYLLVRHIRDQPTGTLMLAVVISPFLLEPLFLAHVTSPLFCFRHLLQTWEQSGIVDRSI